MSKTCPHCGGQRAVPILRGLPTDEAMEAAERGELALGGCDVSQDDPTHTCLACGSQWSSSDDETTTAISENFADYFSNWEIRLPRGAEAARARGLIRKAGWTIHYLFGEGEEPFLEFYAVHRMTNDRHHRLYASGRVEDLSAIQELYGWDPKVPGSEEEARQRYVEHNRAVAHELQRLGLYPQDDINTYLRTNDVDLTDG